MVTSEKLIAVNKKLIAKFNENNGKVELVK
jgi:hypothetical protein